MKSLVFIAAFLVAAISYGQSCSTCIGSSVQYAQPQQVYQYVEPAYAPATIQPQKINLTGLYAYPEDDFVMVGNVRVSARIQPAQRVQSAQPQAQTYAREPNAIDSRGYPCIIGEGTAAYAHALREAQIIASHGGNYAHWPDGGHPLGNAPGARYSGTGYTWDMNRPGHCWENEIHPSRIIARARARGINGAWFWSAHYR